MSKITLYKLEANNKAEIINEKPFKLEREISVVRDFLLRQAASR